ncbi:helix-turn-helix transcriptional regulator [Sediminitomix flava]|uniref:Regulatory LuxR family protein n=1 Tax=Sediminitomix flava TaxID=379075 RepID=A0A315ZCW9_SEDFL|nr:helix-turn-helix transcriptional regulator [Sediminitomix flava]PWJ42943.1 regulatory LuxR family protein [Sediminitomix flava]
MQEVYEKYLKELKSESGISEEELKDILQQFHPAAQMGIVSNMLFYILNLQTQQYEFVSEYAESVSGFTAEDFLEKGTAILQELLYEKSFKLLTEELFPKMNKVVTELPPELMKEAIFELGYHFKNKKTGELVPITEYSSYAKLDEQGRPILSSGVCLESNTEFEGVSGIVRIKLEKKQEVIFDKKIGYNTLPLTKTEKEIIKLLKEGRSRKEIAELQFVSSHTVGTHIKNIYRKLGVNKIAELLKLIENNPID